MTGPTIHVEPEEMESYAEELHSVYANLLPPEPPADYKTPVLAAMLAARRHTAVRRVALAGIAIGIAVVLDLGVGQHPPLQPKSALAVELLPAASALNCELAIHAFDDSGTTGFIVINNGQATFRQTELAGAANLTYLPGLGVWLSDGQGAAAPGGAPAPDGNSYALNGRVGNDYVISLTDRTGTRVIYRGAARVTVGHILSNGLLAVTDLDLPGAYIQPPAGTQITSLPPSFDVMALQVQGGNAWLNPKTGVIQPFNFTADVPESGQGGAGYVPSTDSIWFMNWGAASTVYQVDLATGQTVEWLNPQDLSGTANVIAGDSQGNIIVQVSQGDAEHTDQSKRGGMQIETILMTAPHQFKVLNSGKYGAAGTMDLAPESATSGSNVWLASDDGQIWRYNPSTGLREIAKVTTSTNGSPGVAISAGSCS